MAVPFHWDDPLLLEQQLTQDERMVRDAARAFAQDKLMPRVLNAFRHETAEPEIFREMGEMGTGLRELTRKTCDLLVRLPQRGTVESLAPGSASRFALLPFEPGTGNFTKVVQRVPVRIRFDPARLQYEDILRYFFRLHDPTTLNRQGNDVGSSYRSAIFWRDEQQRQAAEKVKAEVNRSGKWKDPVVTEVTEASTFWPAEDYHQDYLQKNPGGYTCHWLRD